MKKKIKDGAIFMFWLTVSVSLIAITTKDGGNICPQTFLNALGLLIWGGFRFRAGEMNEKRTIIELMELENENTD